jgi:hypothetical protein
MEEFNKPVDQRYLGLRQNPIAQPATLPQLVPEVMPTVRQLNGEFLPFTMFDNTAIHWAPNLSLAPRCERELRRRRTDAQETDGRGLWIRQGVPPEALKSRGGRPQEAQRVQGPRGPGRRVAARCRFKRLLSEHPVV